MQHNSDITSATPFLALTENKEMVLYCIRNDATPAINIPSARSKNEIPVNKWVHIGCEVYPTHIFIIPSNHDMLVCIFDPDDLSFIIVRCKSVVY